MKRILTTLAAAFALAGCAKDSAGKVIPPTPAQQQQYTATALQVAALALNVYSQTQTKGMTPQQTAAAASADLSGASVIANAYAGSNNNVAILATGAKNAAAMATVVSAMPPDTFPKGKITPQTAAILAAAAAQVAANPAQN